MVPGWRVAPAVDRPSQRRGLVLVVLEVQISAFDQPACEPNLTEQRRPMERSFPEQPTPFRYSSCIQPHEPHVFRSEAGSSDERRIALAVLAVPLKVEIRSGMDQRFDKGQFLASF